MTQPTTQAWAAAGIDFSVTGAVAWVTLNRPELRNAVDVRMRNALLAAIEEIRDDPGIRAAVVTGAGSAFCSGADLSGPDPVEASPERRRGDTGIIAREC
jgi:2-(1,2-epoxy-1,2-dihydrophenyl)acetyl-CoA isomerase